MMLYAVLSNLRSLRETCLGFTANATRMNHLGIDHMICRRLLFEMRIKSACLKAVSNEY